MRPVTTRLGSSFMPSAINASPETMPPKLFIVRSTFFGKVNTMHKLHINPAKAPYTTGSRVSYPNAYFNYGT